MNGWGADPFCIASVEWIDVKTERCIEVWTWIDIQACMCVFLRIPRNQVYLQEARTALVIRQAT